jgi:DNA polymerase-3 subunit epsilon
MRQIVLDTETTGLEPTQGHRIIEIGCVEVINRRLTGNHFHQYLQPDREIDAGAIEVHGITNEFLEDKPRFEDVAEDFLAFIKGAELVIHNAPFDVGFIDHELALLAKKEGKARGKKSKSTTVNDVSTVLDTLTLARQMHPGQRNSLDALCKRYEVDNAQREKHGALLDAEILADVYLAMTGGQGDLSLGGVSSDSGLMHQEKIRRLDTSRPALKIITATKDEIAEHASRLDAIDEASEGNCVWKGLGE